MIEVKLLKLDNQSGEYKLHQTLQVKESEVLVVLTRLRAGMFTEVKGFYRYDLTHQDTEVSIHTITPALFDQTKIHMT